MTTARTWINRSTEARRQRKAFEPLWMLYLTIAMRSERLH